MGFIASTFSVLMNGAPLSIIFEVLRRGTHVMSFRLILMCNITSALWCCYGLTYGDRFISVTNILGGIVSFLSLCLYLIVPSRIEKFDN